MPLQAGSDPAPRPALGASRRLTGFGLTAPQMAIWLDQALHPHKPIYNTGQTLTITGELDLARFGAALRMAIAENDALRLRFSSSGSVICQEIVDDVEDGLEARDFSSHRDPERAATAWIERIFWAPLTPADFPLFRFAIARVSPRRFIWLQKYHHLIIDATGRQLVAERVAVVYDALARGEQPPAALGGSYRGARDGEDAYLASDQYAADEAYWLRRFRDVPPGLVRADASLSEKSRSGRATRLHFALMDGTWDRLRAFARAHNSSPFKIICGAAWSCFSRLYGTRELVFGVAVANRTAADVKRTVGAFSKLIPFRLALDPAMPLSAALAALDGQLGDDLKHQQFPTDRIHGALQLRRLRRHGLFDISINYVRNDYGFSCAGAPVACTNLSSGFALPWSVMALEYGRAGIDLVVDYDGGRISADEAGGVLRSLRDALIAAPDAADAPIGHRQTPLDRASVPSARSEPAHRAPERAAEAQPPHDELDDAVLAIWRDIFRDRALGPDANFFDAGGDSLKAIIVVGECNARFDVDLPLTVLFERPTIRELVDAIRGAAAGGAASPLVSLKPGANRPPLVLIHPIGGTVFCYGDIASRIGGDVPVYGIQAAGLRLGERMPRSIEEMAGDYVHAASERLGDGPWHLAGWSFGGAVALEMAHHLDALGRPVASVTLIDTPARPTQPGAEDERATLIAVAGALGVDIGTMAASNAALALPDIIAAAARRPGAPAISEEQLERMIALVRNLRRLRRSYRPRPFSGPILLVRATGTPAADQDAFDWSSVGRVETLAVPATHQSIIFPPHADAVAGIFGNVLAGTSKACVA